jgi:hypothetical protein
MFLPTPIMNLMSNYRTKTTSMLHLQSFLNHILTYLDHEPHVQLQNQDDLYASLVIFFGID